MVFFYGKNYESLGSTKAGNFLVIYVTNNFSRKVLYHGTSWLNQEITMTCAKIKIIHSNRIEWLETGCQISFFLFKSRYV
jgi:hypothetical protein